ncbi:hypothetical protein EVAR_66897_1 [Eumeta japonica]|uniref:Uncharacterized protein n=1 Tax=Eumeta variegata TaxID=151549 RepID=A0A4C2ACN0_EUMVA|nr:hypothetical protein EVAR_66897_1 [Eumeta japonica]
MRTGAKSTRTGCTLSQADGCTPSMTRSQSEVFEEQSLLRASLPVSVHCPYLDSHSALICGRRVRFITLHVAAIASCNSLVQIKWIVTLALALAQANRGLLASESRHRCDQFRDRTLVCRNTG